MAEEQVIAGRFELREQIGSGGMGNVWRAWDRKHDREVAVKQLSQGGAAMLLRFVREQGLRIEHPHVVAPSGWAADDDIVALSMDLVRGGSVDTLIRDHGALPESYVAVLMHQLVSALAEIHRHGVVHRDIKPANLLLEATGSDRPCLRVADFGVAVVRDEPRLTETLMSVGTPGYLAPDLATGAEPAPMHDLYAAGVVGQRLLTGARVSDLPEHANFRLWPLLRWMAASDPRQRPRTGEQVLQVMQSEHLVPAGTPWLEEMDPPTVFDQLGAEPGDAIAAELAHAPHAVAGPGQQAVANAERGQQAVASVGSAAANGSPIRPAEAVPRPTVLAQESETPGPQAPQPQAPQPQASRSQASRSQTPQPQAPRSQPPLRRRSLWLVAVVALAGAAVLLLIAVVLIFV